MVHSGLRDTVAYTIAQLGLIYNLYWAQNNGLTMAASLDNWNLSRLPVASPELIRLTPAAAETSGSFTPIPGNQLPALTSSFAEGKFLI